jgi:hypothetical protein
VSGLTLLAVGGPKHGEQLPYKDGQTRLNVPSLPDLRVQVVSHWDAPSRYCVHGGDVISRYDGDRHFVSADAVARLYGLAPREWRRADQRMPGTHPNTGYCLRPEYNGTYRRMDLMPLGVTSTALSIGYVVYERRVVSDRAVWFYVGS